MSIRINPLSTSTGRPPGSGPRKSVGKSWIENSLYTHVSTRPGLLSSVTGCPRSFRSSSVRTQHPRIHHAVFSPGHGSTPRSRGVMMLIGKITRWKSNVYLSSFQFLSTSRIRWVFTFILFIAFISFTSTIEVIIRR